MTRLNPLSMSLNCKMRNVIEQMSNMCQIHAPILTVGDLESEMEAKFPIPDDSIVESKKKIWVTHTARHMKSETMMQTLREKKKTRSQ